MSHSMKLYKMFILSRDTEEEKSKLLIINLVMSVRLTVETIYL